MIKRNASEIEEERKTERKGREEGEEGEEKNIFRRKFSFIDATSLRGG